MDISKLKNSTICLLVLLFTYCSTKNNYEYEHKLHKILGLDNITIIDKHKSANFDAHGEWWVCEKYTLDELSLDTTIQDNNWELAPNKWQKIGWFSKSHNYIFKNIIKPICNYYVDNDMANDLQLINRENNKWMYKLYCYPDTIEPIKVIIVMCDSVEKNIYIIDTKLF